MYHRLRSVLLLGFSLSAFQSFSLSSPVADGPFTPDWASLNTRQPAAWFADAKFGIWAHWGPQTQPSKGDWYAHYLYKPGGKSYDHHVKTYGHPSEFGFKDILPLWKAERFNADALAALYQKAGARYVVAMANHHDNFDNWNSPHQPWNSVNIGPKRDIVGEWKTAAAKHGLRFGVSIHNINSWGWYEVTRDSDKSGPKAGVPYDGVLTAADGKGKWWDGLDPAALYGPPHRPGPQGDNPTPAFIDNWFLRTRQLIDDYQPDLLEFDLASPTDFWRQWVKFEDIATPRSDDQRVGMVIAAHYYNRQRAWRNGADEGIITLKSLPPERRSAITLAVETDVTREIMPQPWTSEQSMGNWHYDGATRYMPPARVVSLLVETVARNGNLLLNVVQKPDGTVAGDQEATLLAVGRWLDVNGEAIYATRPWRIFGEGPNHIQPRGNLREQNRPPPPPTYTASDIRFTTKAGALYATVLALPREEILIRSLASESVTAVRLLGSDTPPVWRQSPEGLRITPPASLPSEYAVVFKITLTRP